MKITIDMGETLDEVLTLDQHRNMVSSVFAEFKELFEAKGVEPVLLVRLESTFVDSVEHTPNWPIEDANSEWEDSFGPDYEDSSE